MKNFGGINWKVRFNNPQFYAQVLIAILAPILAYMGISYDEITTWSKLGTLILEAIGNPYVVGLTIVSVYNAINDPTVAGFKDSDQALDYDKPKKGAK